MNDEIIEILNNELQKAIEENEVPVAAIMIKNKKIVTFNHNRKIQNKNPMDHAEILCIKETAQLENSWNLKEYELITTLKPCKMCQEIIKEARIKKIYYFTDLNDKKNIKLKMEKIHNNKSTEYSKILTNFFKNKRKENKYAV